jgi:hypothetical protein
MRRLAGLRASGDVGAIWNNPITKERAMAKNWRGLIAIVAIGVALMMPARPALADDLRELSAEWWQWAFSIPGPDNPLLDTTAAECVVGQRGPVWFLAGDLGLEPGQPRTCTVPEGKPLFFPVITSGQFDSPNLCGQDANSLSVADMRANNAAFVDGATNMRVLVDGVRAGRLERVRSRVFDVALPADNVFVELGITPCPTGIYSPTVADGFYVLLEPLDVGTHTLVVHAESGAFVFDVTRILTVAPVAKK